MCHLVLTMLITKELVVSQFFHGAESEFIFVYMVAMAIPTEDCSVYCMQQLDPQSSCWYYEQLFVTNKQLLLLLTLICLAIL